MKKNSLLTWTAVLLVALIATSADAADYREYLFRGKVVDTDDNPLADVKLTLKHRKNLRVYETETNKKGEYKFVGLPHGVYDVTIAKEGYQTHTQKWQYETTHQEMKRVTHPPLVLLSADQVQRMESSKRVKGHFEEANAMLKEGNLDGALESALSILKDRPDDANGLYIAGLCYLEKGQVDEAISVLSRSAELQPDYAPTFIRLGMGYQHKGDLDAALAAYDRAVEIEPQNVAPLYNAGAMLFNASRPADALSYLERAAAIAKDDYGILEMAGYSALQGESYDKALEFFTQAKTLTNDESQKTLLDELITAVKTQLEKTLNES